MNEVSIIINGVRYDAVEDMRLTCFDCDIKLICDKYEDASVDLCQMTLHPNAVFKKSDKKFER